MLTDRQQKFYLDIQNLTSNLKEGPERQYLWRAWNDISTGKNFKYTINQLDINLKELEKSSTGISDGTKQLLEKLIATYGEPVGEFKNTAFSKNWYISNSNPDLVYQGRGWTSRKSLEKEKKSKFINPIVFIVVSIYMLVAIFLVLSMYFPIFPWLISKLGKRNFYIAAGVTIVVILFLLIIIGRLKHKNQKKINDEPTN